MVPEMPKEDTPARRGPVLAGQGMGWVSRDMPAFQSMWGEGWAACRVAGRMPCRMAVIILITPATPDAA